MGNYLEDIYRERTKEIRKIGIKKGNLVNLSGEYGSVLHEVAEVYDSKDSEYPRISFYKAVESARPDQKEYNNKVKTDSISFYRIDAIFKKIPKGKYVHVVECREGAFSDRRGNLHEIPKKYFEKV